ncbi:hypothetical protein [Aquabacterium sp.]|uniref:hypothetical protein n=1 Tax=Aquabacterium sp. TaxID=1872578 RepID=UPI0025C1833D|nr:hypothetical protein [Aquabacterium sp.]
MFAHREAFVLEKHATGPNLDQSPRDVLRLIEKLSGVPVVEAFQEPSLDVDLKWHARYARQNGIHGSPSFMVDGLLAADINSGDELSVWLDKMKLA